MLGAVEFQADIGEDHTIRIPAEVPVGRARVIVLVDRVDAEHRATMAEERRKLAGKYQGQLSISEDFDEPLPPEIQRYFDGEDDGQLGQGR